MDKSPDAFRTISEVAEWLQTPTHVLRFWESRFKQVKPVKRAGGRRYYRPKDMELLGGIKVLLHSDGLTIRGVQKLLREEGVRHVASLSPPVDGSGAIEGGYSTAPMQTEAPIDLDVPQAAPQNVVPLVTPSQPSTPSRPAHSGAASARPPDPSPAIDLDTPATPQAGETADTPETHAPAAPSEAAASAAPAFSSSREPARGPRGDILVGPDQTHPDYQTPPPEKPAATVATAPPAPKPGLAADVPDDPQDNDKSEPSIMGVAAALRRVANAQSSHKPHPEVFGELYQRLTHLRHRMEKLSDTKSAD